MEYGRANRCWNKCRLFLSVLIPVISTVRHVRGLEVGEQHTAFETGALLITIVLFGKWIESNAKKRTSRGVEQLLTLQPINVTLETGALVHVLLVDEGDQFRVLPGETVPLDGVIVDGNTTLVESMLTGESWPVQKGAGEQVFGGCINTSDAIGVRCTNAIERGLLQNIIDIVKRGQQLGAPVEAVADRISAYFVPIVILIAVFVTVLWYVLAVTNVVPEEWTDDEGDVLFALLFGLSVVVIACPCALGLATPTVVMMATSIGASKLGVLYRDGGKALQAMHSATTVLFDKTGTLTVGHPVVTAARMVQDGSLVTGDVGRKTWQSVAATEQCSRHPIAHALITGAEGRGFDASGGVMSNHNVQGSGIWCEFEDGITAVGKAEWVTRPEEWADGRNVPGITLSDEIKDVIENWEGEGKTVVMARACCAPRWRRGCIWD